MDIPQDVKTEKPRNMAELYKENSRKLDLTPMPEDGGNDYVYQSKKKAVVMVRKKAASQLQSESMNQPTEAPVEGPSSPKRGGATPFLETTNKSYFSTGGKKSTFAKNQVKGGNLSVYKQKPKKEESNNYLMSDKAIKENHLLRSMKKLKQQDDKTAATRVGVGGGKNENFQRMTAQLTNVRKRYGARSDNKRPNTKEQKALDQMYQKQAHDEMPGDLKSQFGGLPPSQLLAIKKGEQWMKKRKMFSKAQVNRKHVEFAKDLFLSWDDEGNGELNPDEIKKPFISMGLSADSKFASKLFEALASGNKRKKKVDLKLTLQDFIKIFKSDKFGDKISQIIKGEIHSENSGRVTMAHTKQFLNQSFSPSSPKKGKKNLAISMKNENGIVEFPLEPGLQGQVNIYKRESTENGHVSSKKTLKIDDNGEDLIEENYQQAFDDPGICLTTF